MDNVSDSNEEDLLKQNEGHYVLKLFIAGASVNSTRAIGNLRGVCEQYIKDNYTLEIVDVYQHEGLAKAEQIIALPMLVKSFPLPERKLIGDMSNKEKVLKGLGISSI